MEAITREEKLMDGQDVKPITRKEKILAGEDLKTITREEYFLKKYRGGGGGDITVESLNVTENGTYTAPTGKAYSPVKVELPLSSKTITENGTYTASDDNLAGFNEVTVAVEGYAKKSIANTPTAIATFNASALPMPSLKVGIEAVQSGTGDPSPTNIRPITGWGAVNVNRCGKNLFGGELMKNGIKSAIPSAIIDESEKSITFSSSAVVEKAFTSECGLTGKFKENTAYTCIFTMSTTRKTSNLRLYYTDGTFLNVPSTESENTKETIVVVTSSNKTLYNINKANMGGNTTIYYDECGVFEGVITAEDFVPYNGTTYTTQLKDGQGNPLVCYGGELSNENGVQSLTNETEIVVLDGSNDEAWEMAQGAFLINGIFNWDSTTSATNPVCMCNMYIEENAISSSAQGSSRSDFSFFNQTNYIDRLWVKDSRYSTVEDFKTALASQPLQIRYTLATPQTIPQDNLAIATQDGTNNIWADTGDVLEGSYFKEL